MINHDDLQNIVKRIIGYCHPERIYLFGSYAKGTMNRNSDLDFIVVKQTDLPRHLRGSNMASALAGFAIEIDLLWVTPEELELGCKNSYSLLSNVMPTALLLYSRFPTTETTLLDNRGRAEQNYHDSYSSFTPP
jgi:predicted nucleotidyltransferase